MEPDAKSSSRAKVISKWVDIAQASPFENSRQQRHDHDLLTDRLAGAARAQELLVPEGDHLRPAEQPRVPAEEGLGTPAEGQDGDVPGWCDFK